MAWLGLAWGETGVVGGGPGARPDLVWFPPVSPRLFGGKVVCGGAGRGRGWGGPQTGPRLVLCPLAPGPYTVLKHDVFGDEKCGRKTTHISGP